MPFDFEHFKVQSDLDAHLASLGSRGLETRSDSDFLEPLPRLVHGSRIVMEIVTSAGLKVPPAANVSSESVSEQPDALSFKYGEATKFLQRNAEYFYFATSLTVQAILCPVFGILKKQSPSSKPRMQNGKRER